MFQNNGEFDNLVGDIANIINKKEPLPQEIQDAAAAASKEVVGKSLEDRRHIMTKHLLGTGITLTHKMSDAFKDLVEAFSSKRVSVQPKILKVWAEDVSSIVSNSGKKITPSQVLKALDTIHKNRQSDLKAFEDRRRMTWETNLDTEELIALAKEIPGAKINSNNPFKESLGEAKKGKIFTPVKVPAKVLKDWAAQVSEAADKKISAKQMQLAADKAIQENQLEFLRPKGKWVTTLEPEELVTLASFIKGVNIVAPG